MATAHYSQQQAYRLARRHGATDSEARFLAAVMMPESGGNPRARNPSSGATGLWQIHPGGTQYYDPDKNVATAIYKLRTQGKGAWEAYTRGLVGAFTPSGGNSPQPAAIYSGTEPPVGVQGDPRRAVLSALIASSQERNPDYEGVIAALGQLGATRRAAAPSPALSSQTPAGGGATSSGGISELFYDPLGAIKDGQPISPIGGHSDHVHFASGSPQLMLAAIRKARQLGLNVTENPYTDSSVGGHVEGSYHYRTFPGRYNGRRLGEGIDASGNAQAMAALYRWLSRRSRQ